MGGGNGDYRKKKKQEEGEWTQKTAHAQEGRSKHRIRREDHQSVIWATRFAVSKKNQLTRKIILKDAIQESKLKR